MTTQLPTRPNLEHLRSQAKDLLDDLKKADREALGAFQEFAPDPAKATFTLSDAQLIVARRCGYLSWPKLVHHVEALNALDGTWRFTSLEVEGAAMPPHAYQHSAIVIDGDRFQMADGGATYEGSCQIDSAASPKTIDIRFVAGPEKGNTSLGIYEVQGDHLKVCLGFTGVPRPTSFATKAGSGHALETLERGQLDPTPTTRPEERKDDPALTEGFGPITPLMEALQGNWTPTSIVRDGIALPAFFLKNGQRSMQGIETTVTFGNQVFMEAQTKMNDQANPPTVDYLHTSGPNEGRAQLGILTQEDEDLVICFAEPGHPRPNAFESPEGGGLTLSRWKRS